MVRFVLIVTILFRVYVCSFSGMFKYACYALSIYLRWFVGVLYAMGFVGFLWVSLGFTLSR